MINSCGFLFFIFEKLYYIIKKLLKMGLDLTMQDKEKNKVKIKT